MYLWKYWRDTRIVFGVCIAGIALLYVLLPGSTLSVSTNQQEGNGLVVALILGIVLQVFPVGFIAWLLGSYGVGRDLGEKSGSYIFSRPRSRAFFVWSDWGFGMAELLAIVVLLNSVLGLYMRRFLIASGDQNHGSYLVVANQQIPLPFAVLLNCVAVFLLAALVFSLTYFSTVLVRHSKGLMLAVGLLLGYLILKQVVAHYWPGVHLPGMVASPWTTGMGSHGLPEGLGLSVALRAALIVAFPLAAQLLLEKTDI